MNEQMQKDFEKWADQCGYTLKMVVQQDGLGTAIYANGQTRSAWNAWRASRQALVVKLPEYIKHKDTQDYFNACLRALDAAGVSFE